jgi:hypothetical protein
VVCRRLQEDRVFELGAQLGEARREVDPRRSVSPGSVRPVNWFRHLVIGGFQIPIQMDSGFMFQTHPCPRLIMNSAVCGPPRWIRCPVLIVSADLVCGLCSSAPSLDDAAELGGWSFWRDESRRGGLLCYVPGHFDWLLFNYILV